MFWIIGVGLGAEPVLSECPYLPGHLVPPWVLELLVGEGLGAKQMLRFTAVAG